MFDIVLVDPKRNFPGEANLGCSLSEEIHGDMCFEVILSTLDSSTDTKALHPTLNTLEQWISGSSRRSQAVKAPAD